MIKLTPSSLAQRKILNVLLISGYFSTFASTISSTLLIVYRIHNSISNQNHTQYKKRFKHVVDVLVQSAAVYSLALLVSTIAGLVLITSGHDISLSLFAVLNYESSAILFFVSVRFYAKYYYLGKKVKSSESSSGHRTNYYGRSSCPRN